MKKLIFLIIPAMIVFTGCRTTRPASEAKSNFAVAQLPDPANEPAGINFSDQTTWVLGYFNPDRLTSEPHSSWYYKGYDDYQINTEAINKLMDINKDGLSIKIVMGTWCPDSRREVPRFMRIMDIWHFPVSEITYIGVDDGKLSPVGEYVSLDIQRVPTFIIYKNNIESGRIIENPKTSLEQDLINILTRNE
jgi:hypothetical protein